MRMKEGASSVDNNAIAAIVCALAPERFGHEKQSLEKIALVPRT